MAAPNQLSKLPDWQEIDNLIKDSDDWIASERYYYIAKMICHASNYGMRGDAFRMNVLEKSHGKIVLTKAQAEIYLEAYHKLFPEIKQWHREVEFLIKKSNRLYNLQGYPLEFGNILTADDLKEAFARVPQSTVGTITNIAFTNMQRYIEGHELKQWDLLHNGHDSYLVECPDTDKFDCAMIMKKFIEQDLVSPRGEEFKMRSGVSIGSNWGPYKLTTNPGGMKEVKT